MSGLVLLELHDRLDDTLCPAVSYRIAQTCEALLDSYVRTTLHERVMLRIIFSILAGVCTVLLDCIVAFSRI